MHGLVLRDRAVIAYGAGEAFSNANRSSLDGQPAERWRDRGQHSDDRFRLKCQPESAATVGGGIEQALTATVRKGEYLYVDSATTRRSARCRRGLDTSVRLRDQHLDPLSAINYKFDYAPMLVAKH